MTVSWYRLSAEAYFCSSRRPRASKELLELDKNGVSLSSMTLLAQKLQQALILHPGAWHRCLAPVHLVLAACCQLVQLTSRYPDPNLDSWYCSSIRWRALACVVGRAYRYSPLKILSPPIDLSHELALKSRSGSSCRRRSY